MGGDSCCYAVGRVDSDGVGGAVWVGVVRDHLREFEAGGLGGEEGRADVTRGVPDHEGGFCGREVLRGDDEVAFVFAVGGVEDDDVLATC